MTETAIRDALAIASEYGSTDGDHHKAWVIDQIVRTLTGCPTVTRTGTHAHGTYTFEALGESDAYRAFVADHNDGEDGPDTYHWDEGIAP